MTYVRRLIFAVIVMAFISFAWYGAEMMIHGQSQRSVVDLFIAVCLAMSISGKIEKGVEASERKRKFAEKFAEEFIEQCKKREEAKDGDRKEA